MKWVPFDLPKTRRKTTTAHNCDAHLSTILIYILEFVSIQSDSRLEWSFSLRQFAFESTRTSDRAWVSLQAKQLFAYTDVHG